MDSVRVEDLIYGLFLAFLAVVSVYIALKSARSGDREALGMSVGFAIMCGFFSLILCTGWVNVLPLPS